MLETFNIVRAFLLVTSNINELPLATIILDKQVRTHVNKSLEILPLKTSYVLHKKLCSVNSVWSMVVARDNA